MNENLEPQWPEKPKNQAVMSVTGLRLWVIRIVALPCMAFGLTLMFDSIIARPENVTGIICDKQTHWSRRTGQHYMIFIHTDAWGGRDLEHEVESDVYKKCSPGDAADIAVTPYFKLWKKVSVTCQGKVVAESGFPPAGISGLLFLFPALSLVPKISATRSAVFWAPTIFMEAAAIIIYAFRFYNG